MTPETSGEVRVAQIIRVSPPSNSQVRKYIPIVDCQNRLCCLVDVLRSLDIEIRVVLLIEADDGSRHFFRLLPRLSCGLSSALPYLSS